MFDYREYEEFPVGLRIRFAAPNLDLREVAIASAQIHRLVNKVAEDVLELPSRNPELYSRSGPWASVMYGRPYDPLIVSLEISQLSFESFSAKTRLRIHRAARDLSIGVVGSLVASVIWSVASSIPKSTQISETPSLPKGEKQDVRVRAVDVGPNIVQIAKGLGVSGKPWELTVEDTTTGQKVEIRSKR